MGWNFRKSFKIGPARINLSKSGVGYSVGIGGVRYTKRAGAKRKSEKTSFLGVIFKLFCIALVGFIVMALAAAIYTFVIQFKWVFLALGALILAGLITYFAIKHRRATKDKSERSDTIDPAL